MMLIKMIKILLMHFQTEEGVEFDCAKGNKPVPPERSIGTLCVIDDLQSLMSNGRFSPTCSINPTSSAMKIIIITNNPAVRAGTDQIALLGVVNRES